MIIKQYANDGFEHTALSRARIIDRPNHVRNTLLELATIYDIDMVSVQQRLRGAGMKTKYYFYKAARVAG